MVEETGVAEGMAVDADDVGIEDKDNDIADGVVEAAAMAAAAAALRIFLLSFFETDFTFGRSLIAVLGSTSDGATIGADVVA